ncbi:MAG: YlxR family protein [Dehalococcoidia bacterium]
MRKRHVPQRSCIVCGTKAAKGDLFRVVLDQSGHCLVDQTGKSAGRGAYLCHRSECWQRAATGDRLSHSLRATVSEADREALAQFGKSLPSVPVAG